MQSASFESGINIPDPIFQKSDFRIMFDFEKSDMEEMNFNGQYIASYYETYIALISINCTTINQEFNP